MRKTSASDNGVYPQFCYLASKQDELFANFKRHPAYTRILEHVSPEQGAAYLQIVLENNNLDLNWDFILQNDKIGNPNVAKYDFGSQDIICSPTTLRYLKVASDIVKLFDSSKIKTVSEIGIGYAGQCRILKNFLPIDEYYLVDLPEVLALAERFLDETNLDEQGGTLH